MYRFTVEAQMRSGLVILVVNANCGHCEEEKKEVIPLFDRPSSSLAFLLLVYVCGAHFRLRRVHQRLIL
jgi:hypothetical protein